LLKLHNAMNIYIKARMDNIKYEVFFVDENNIKSMTIEEQNSCEGHITLDEIKRVLNQHKTANRREQTGFLQIFISFF
jgi:hypothetical protein